jgi:acyl-CoA reductase-like NAD-dependent aldehyde dehydrogenase
VRAEKVQIQNFIDGQFVEPLGKYFDNVEPTMGTLNLEVADCGARDIDLAITAAETVSRFRKRLI